MNCEKNMNFKELNKFINEKNKEIQINDDSCCFGGNLNFFYAKFNDNETKDIWTVQFFNCLKSLLAEKQNEENGFYFLDGNDVMTADHNTGGMTMGAKGGGYRWEPKYLRNVSASTRTIANQQTKNGFDSDEISNQLGFELNKDEISLLKKAHGKDKKQLFKALKRVVDKRTNTGWTTSGHTGVDVPVFAFGAGKDKYAGQIDNTDIAKNIFKQLGK